jgi:hypothetical protein
MSNGKQAVVNAHGGKLLVGVVLVVAPERAVVASWEQAVDAVHGHLVVFLILVSHTSIVGSATSH